MIQLSKSSGFTEEYCCSIVIVGSLEDVPNSDNLKRTYINGESIVVNKNDVHEGDIMLYVSNECQVANWFLSANNLYQHWTLNANADIIRNKIETNSDFEKSEEFKSLRGYFGDNGRIKMIKLRGCPSFGCLFSPEAIGNALPVFEGFDWTSHIGEDFDSLIANGEEVLFVQAYVPPTNRRNNQHSRNKVSKWDRLNRMVPKQFFLHYDTAPLKKHLSEFSLDTDITVSVKMHGTSFICGNLLTNIPLRFFKIRRLLNKYLKLNIKESRQDYGMIVSSRKVIKNEWSNNSHPEGYYGQDIWTEYGELIYPYLPKGITLYGEICGFVTGTTKYIQSGYDYSCRTGENFLMPYRITEHQSDGTLKEYSIKEVIDFSKYLQSKLINKIYILPVVYEGKIRDIASDVNNLPDELSKIANIESLEPFCKNKVPREGVVIRINGDEVPEAFKLKGMKFLAKEAKLIDEGNVNMEMSENL